MCRGWRGVWPDCAGFYPSGKDALAPAIISGTVARQRMNAPSPFWQLLFAPEATTQPATAVAMKLLTKRGQPLLLLPSDPQLAIRGLELYPAQTSRSRLARSLAGWILQARLPVGVKSVRVNLTPDDPFVRWLSSWACVASGGSGPPAIESRCGEPLGMERFRQTAGNLGVPGLKGNRAPQA